MSQHHHIAHNAQHLRTRALILQAIRAFFDGEGFVEIDPPALLAYPGQEPYLSPFSLSVENEQGQTWTGYLHTSPEYALKKTLAAGFERIYAMGKCYRNKESFGGMHNPEFTMLEWYRAHKDMSAIMDDCEALFQTIAAATGEHQAFMASWKRISMRDLWQEVLGVNLDDYLDVPSMRALCESYGYTPTDDEPYEDLFYRIFLNHIEPTLGKAQPTIVSHYPAQMAALAELDATDPRYAERFEIYIHGVELANAFTELTNPAEQRRRFIEEQALRTKRKEPVYPLDEDFLAALADMPPAAGIALGVDRLVQLFTNCQNIDHVLVLPASQLFN